MTQPATKLETATPIAKEYERPNGDVVRMGPAATYRLSKPYLAYGAEHEHLFVSTSCVLGEWETYAFPANADGEVLSWTELPCSMKGTQSHAEVLADAGYEIVPSPPLSEGKEK